MIDMNADYSKLSEDAKAIRELMQTRAYEILLRELKQLLSAAQHALITGKDFAEVCYGRGMFDAASALERKLEAKARETKSEKEI